MTYYIMCVAIHSALNMDIHTKSLPPMLIFECWNAMQSLEVSIPCIVWILEFLQWRYIISLVEKFCGAETIHTSWRLVALATKLPVSILILLHGMQKNGAYWPPILKNIVYSTSPFDVQDSADSICFAENSQRIYRCWEHPPLFSLHTLPTSMAPLWS